MENNTLNEFLICLDDVTHDDDFVLCTNCNYYNHYYCSIKWFQTKKNKDLICLHCQTKDKLVVFKKEQPSCLQTIKTFLIKLIKFI